MTSEKTIQKYAALYRDALSKQGYSDVDGKALAYADRLCQMYDSQNYREHNIYPTMNVELIYAVIAICLELRNFGLSNDEIIAFHNIAFQKRKRFFAIILKAGNLLPNAFQLAKKWNINDHEKRLKDHSIDYDYFTVSEDKIEYRISKCMYVEMFETYGIRELCKIFCNTDIQSYGYLTRHMQFIRHSDLSDGDCCYDEVHRK